MQERMTVLVVFGLGREINKSEATDGCNYGWLEGSQGKTSGWSQQEVFSGLMWRTKEVVKMVTGLAKGCKRGERGKMKRDEVFD